VRTIEIDEGWSDDRDVSVFVGRWAWLDVRALVEEHGGGKSLVRVSTHLRPTTLGILNAVAVAAPLLAAASAGVALRWPLAGVAAATVAVVVAIFSGWRTAQTTLPRQTEGLAAVVGLTVVRTDGLAPIGGLVTKLVEYFRERGTEDVSEFEVMREDVRFMLPKTIRQAMTAAGA